MSRRRKQINSNPTLLTVAVIVAILLTYVLLSVKVKDSEEVEAAIKLHSSTDIQANTNAGTGTNTSVVGIDAVGNGVVVWDTISHPGDTSQSGIAHQRFSHDETALGSETLTNTSTTNEQENPDVAMDEDGNYVIVWQGESTGDYDIYMRAYQADGTAVSGETVVNTTTAGDQTAAHVALDWDGPTSATRVIVTWDTDNNGADDDVKYRRFDIDFDTPSAPSAVDGTEQTATSYTTDDQNRNAVAMNTLGEFMITWWGDNSGGMGASFRPFAQNGTALSTDVQINSNTGASDNDIAADKFPRPSLDDDADKRFIIVHEEPGTGNDVVIATRVTCTDPNTGNGDDTDVTCSVEPVNIEVATDDSGTQEFPKVGADYLGNFTVTWRDSDLDGNSDGIGAQSYTYEGKRVNNNFVVNNTTTGSQINPNIAMNTDGFYNIGFVSSGNAYFQNYVNEIFKVQSEVLPYASSTGIETSVDAAIGPNGNHAEVWKSDDGNIYFTLREFDNDATVIADSVAVDDNPGADEGCLDTRATNYVCDNPSVSFFKDTSGAALGKFVIVWERDATGGAGKDIYYQIYDAAGSAEGVPAIVNSATTGDQVEPDVDAGIYDSGGGSDEKKFAAGWVDNNTNNIESAFNDSGFTYDTLFTTCSSCNNVGVSLHASTDRAAFTWVSGSDVHTAKTIAGTQDGGTLNVDSGTGTTKTVPDVAFTDSSTYYIVYAANAHLASGSVVTKEIDFNSGSNPLDSSTLSGSQYTHTDGAQSNPRVTADESSDSVLVVWTDFPTTSAENHIFGQFYSPATTAEYFGPTFRINSTQDGSQSIPAVNMNDDGHVVVAWEGNVDQPSNTDTAGVATQLLQNPLIDLQTEATLAPTAEQEVQVGARFLNVPAAIIFQALDLSTTASQTQAVSIRSNSTDNGCDGSACGSIICTSGDACEGTCGINTPEASQDSICLCSGASCGGDTLKYIEVEDASGVQNFTLSVQATDFTSTSDGFGYIQNDKHFYVKNWDESDYETGTCDDPACSSITAGNCSIDSAECFLIVESSHASTTGFSLHTETEDFVFADSQKTLATKDDGGAEEVGKWRIYPEFVIVVPPVLPPGSHEATITFTLT